MINTTVTVTGLEEAIAKIEALKGAAINLVPALDIIGDYLMKFFMEDVYQTQGGSLGFEWAPLSLKYEQQKERTYGAQPILIASGKMSTSYRLYTASDYLIIQNEAVNSQGDYYARYHQDGTGKMPQRPIMDIQAEQMGYITGIIVQYLTNLSS